MGLKRYLIPAILLFCLGLGIAARKSSTARETVLPAGEDGWISIFEGDSIKGWKILESGNWEVANGILRGSSGRILNRWCWIDFELETKYRGEGILLFRVGSDRTGHVGFEQPGYQYDLGLRELRTAKGELLAREESSGSSEQWHILSLSVSKGLLKFALDGNQLIESSDSTSPLKGRIGFGSDNSSLEIKYVRVRPLSGPEKMNIPAENDYCYVCHANFEYDDPFVTVHEEAEVLCSDCHGPSLEHRSDEDNVIPPDVLFRKPQVDRMCMECHESHENRDHPQGEEILNPVCSDCHGEHKLP